MYLPFKLLECDSNDVSSYCFGNELVFVKVFQEVIDDSL